jgi:hypothetical protein
LLINTIKIFGLNLLKLFIKEFAEVTFVGVTFELFNLIVAITVIQKKMIVNFEFAVFATIMFIKQMTKLMNSILFVNQIISVIAIFVHYYLISRFFFISFSL